MSNPLFQMFGNHGQNNNIVNQFMQFKNSFKGDARQQVQQLLNSGAVSQEQYNQAVQKANALKAMLKI